MNKINQKIKSAAATLAIVLAFSFVCIIFSINSSIVQVDKQSQETFLALSYRDFNILSDDLKYLIENGYEFTLPKDASDHSQNNVSIIIEMDSIEETLKSASLLNDLKIPSIITLNNTMNIRDIESIRSLYLGVDFEFAALMKLYAESYVNLAAAISGIRMDFYQNFGEKCQNIVLSEGSIPTEGIDAASLNAFHEITMFGFGNGMNLYNHSNQFKIYNRIVRINDLSIEDYVHAVLQWTQNKFPISYAMKKRASGRFLMLIFTI